MSGVVRGPGDDPSMSDEEILAMRNRWFDFYTSQLHVMARGNPDGYSCPCCGHVTLTERGGDEICDECGWQDDGQDDHDSHVVRGGPNKGLSLDAARAAYVERGGERLPHVPPVEPRPW